VIATARALRHSSMSMRLSLAAAVLAALLPLTATAGTTPVFHGALRVRQARGVIDQTTGLASLKVTRWRFVPIEGSNGIAFDQEPVLLTISENELKNEYRLEPGALHATRNGRRFVYTNRKAQRGIRMLRIDARPDGTYQVAFALRDVNLSRLVTQDPVCLPFALIVGDDDGFVGLSFQSKFTRRLRVTGTCLVEDWPWADG
jgi:hypothetical protein